MEEKMLPVFPLGVFRDRKPESIEIVVPQATVPNLLDLEKSPEEISLPAATKESHSDLALKVAGFGGQGVLLLGQILAEMGMREGCEVRWLPSYGPAMRSGSAPLPCLPL
jgi:2-oxoisovalerate ferredoxin oxidoreductase beta subunit